MLPKNDQLGKSEVRQEGRDDHEQESGGKAEVFEEKRGTQYSEKGGREPCTCRESFKCDCDPPRKSPGGYDQIMEIR